MKLIAKDLACQRGGRHVFGHVSFQVAAGEGLLLSGPNGAGKTSLLRMVAGFLDPASGALALEGADPELSIGQHAHYVGHLDAVKGGLSVAENLAFWARLLGGGDPEKALARFALESYAHIPAALLSAGQRRRLALSRLELVPRPLWLLDEPTVSLDAASRRRLVAAMRQHLGAGGLIVASSHAPFGIRLRHRLELGGAGARP